MGSSKDVMRPRVLFLGASGFLGSNLMFYFSRFSDFAVAGASRHAHRQNLTPLRDYGEASLAELFDALQPNFVVNCVGIVGHHKVEQNLEEANYVNVCLPRLLGKLTVQRGIHLIHFSSDSVYSGKPDEAPFRETSTPEPFSIYGRQKLESELTVLEGNPSALVLRVNFFGWSPNGRSGTLDHFVSHALNETDPIGYIGYTVTSAYTSTVATVVMQALRSRLSGVFNLGASDALTKFTFGQTVFSMLGIDPGRVIPSKPSVWRVDKTSQRDLSMSSSLIESSLKLSLPSQAKGIETALSELPEILAYFGSGPNDQRKTLGNVCDQ